MTFKGCRFRTILEAFLPGVLCMVLPTGLLHADEVTVAVAANFLPPLRDLEREFEATTGHEISVVSGSTGQLYAQIVNGAPFDVLLAADEERPRRLAESGIGDPSSVFTYAIGQLALWSPRADHIDDTTLTRIPEIRFRWFAIAEPKVAPYGAAAKQVLERLGVWEAIEPRIVRGQSIAQTFAAIATGNADLGLVALSQVLSYEGPASYAIVPRELYDPIRQDAILLRRSADKAAAVEFMGFLEASAAESIIERFGYAVDDSGRPLEGAELP
jgi:molybdate transport system substrate-binding protein